LHKAPAEYFFHKSLWISWENKKKEKEVRHFERRSARPPQVFHFWKHLAMCVGQILHDNVLSRYTKMVLLVLYV
jgi:hypothetical protein